MQPLSQVLVGEGYLTAENLTKAEAYVLGIPFVNLETERVDPDVLRIVPEPIARAHNIVAFRKKGNELEVAMLDPDDLPTIDFIKKKSNLKILPRLTTVEGIRQALKQYSKTLEAEFGDIIQKEAVGIRSYSDEGNKGLELKPEELQKAAEEMPVIRIVDTLLRHAILQRASDIHIEPSEQKVTVRYRIDGVLRDAMQLPEKASSGIVARIKVLSSLKLDEHRLPQDGRFKVETEEYKYSVRVSILPVFNGEKVVMRLLPETARTLSSLLGAGVPIVRSLEIASNTLGNWHFRVALEQASQALKQGGKLSKTLQQYPDLYPPVFVQMVEVGEETGQTASLLSKIADFFEGEVDALTRNLASVVEPVLMLFIGAAVGFFAVSMLQPMYSLLQSLQQQ